MNDQSDRYRELMHGISMRSRSGFQRATREELKWLRKYGLPDSIIDFYAKYALDDTAEINFIRLHTLQHLREENEQAMPGMVSCKFGFIVFASDNCGDGYCFDTQSLDAIGEPAVVWLPHDEVGEGMLREDLESICRKVATNFSEFLQRFRDASL